MTRIFPALALGAALFTTTSIAQEAPALDTTDSKVGYAIGLQIGGNLGQQGFGDIDLDALLLGLKDATSGAEPRLDQATIQAAFQEYQAEADARKAAKADEALAAGRAFLEENKSKDGIKTTGSGLQYKIEKAGEGDSPTPERTVTVHYTGRLLDGTVFDSSVERGEPTSFPVRGVIQGWQEALQLMKPGAVWDVWIPSEIAYGTRGAGSDIGPNEVLHFTIELISIDN